MARGWLFAVYGGILSKLWWFCLLGWIHLSKKKVQDMKVRNVDLFLISMLPFLRFCLYIGLCGWFGPNLVFSTTLLDLSELGFDL